MKLYPNIDSYKKDKNRFLTIASLPIILVAISLISDIFLQSQMTYSIEAGFEHVNTAGMLSSFSALTLLLASISKDVNLTRSLPAAIDVIYAIAMIFASSKSIKGKKNYFLITFILYCVDYLFLIPATIVSGLHVVPISFRPLDYALLFIIHSLGLGIMIYGLIIRQKLALYEEKEGIQA